MQNQSTKLYSSFVFLRIIETFKEMSWDVCLEYFYVYCVKFYECASWKIGQPRMNVLRIHVAPMFIEPYIIYYIRMNKPQN